ncbi:MAG: VWA domain-containing protein [Spirochaetes bacterium]|nr:VWA domain-containing protein [Spirochaetota bacterium]
MDKKLIYIFIFFINNIMILLILLRQKQLREKYFNEFNFYFYNKYKLFLFRVFILFIMNFFFLLLMLDFKGGKRKVEIKDEFIDTAILIDVSTSMKAQDIYPDRLRASILLTNNLIKKSKNNRFSLIIFSLEPYIQIPFTTNIDYFSFILNGLRIETNQTSLINNAISKGYSLIRRTPSKLKYILIFSDMEFWEEIDKNLIKLITGEGIRIYFFIIGTIEGGKIPIENGFLKDENGEVVITKANIEIVKKLGNINNVFFYNIDKVDFDNFNKICESIFSFKDMPKKYIIVTYKFYWLFAFFIFLLTIFYYLFYSPMLIKIKINEEFRKF